MDYGHTRQQSAELEKLVIQNLQHVVMLTVIVIDYYMAFFILHAISTLDHIITYLSYTDCGQKYW